MSGGFFDYNQYKINQIADDIQQELDKQGLPNEDWVYDREWLEKYPEDGFHYTHPEEIQQIFKDAILALKKASIYTQRIDWYLSGDDGEESLVERLNDELKELQNGR